MFEDEKEEEEISIDFSKITNLFKKKKGEVKEVKKEVEKPKKESKDIDKKATQEKKVEDITTEIKEGFNEKEPLTKEEVIKDDLEDDEEISLDFSKIIKFFKKKKEKKADEVKEKTEDKETEDDEISIDFSKIKEFFKGKKGSKEENKEVGEEIADEELSFDFKKTVDYISRYKHVLIPLIIILFSVFLSVYVRIQPAYLPITDEWARNAVYNYYKNLVNAQIEKQYPNLPETNKAHLVENEFQNFLKVNKDQVEEQIKATSNQFKSKFQFTAENGKDYMYLSDIDTYLWYGETRNYLRNGHFGTDIVEGKDINFLRNGRYGLEMPSITLHPYFGVLLYKFVSIFSDAPLMAVFFFISPIIIAASIIPAFFIGKRIGGNIGGFFAATIIAINSALLSRTPASVADTDAYNIFFPLMILWLFLEAFEAKELKKNIIYAGLSGLFAGLFSKAWMGWWFVFDFVLVTIGIYFVYLMIRRFKNSERSFEPFKNLSIVGGSFFLISAVSVSLFYGFHTFLEAFSNPIATIQMKAVAVTTLWPNVLTTVAEFNVTPLSQITAQMGENLLFWIGLIGLVLLLFNRNKQDSLNWIYLILSGIYYFVILAFEQSLNEPLTFMILISIPIVAGLIKIIYLNEYENVDIKEVLLILIWLLGTAYGFTKGIRFGILMVPAFAVAFGVGIGISYQYLSKWITKELKVNKSITNTMLVLLFGSLLLAPMNAARAIGKNEMILMDDAWYNSLIKIKENSTDAIITSWWDFGHWFVTIAERRVTFDGADQGERIHWVGKSLLTDDEDVAMGILRMLNCGQEKAPHVLEKHLDGDTIKAIDLLNKIIVQDKKQAASTLKKDGLTNEAIVEVLNVTHCDDLIEQYYITSEDMVGKSGVWAHFGSWDFRRAKMWQSVNGKGINEGTKILKEEFNLTDGEADNIYYEIQNTEADKWISPWPGYASGLNDCNKQSNETFTCPIGGVIGILNTTTMDIGIVTPDGIKHPDLLVYPVKDGIIKKEYNDTIGLGMALIPSNDGFKNIIMSPQLTASIFTRLFFMDGHGLKHFKKFNDERSVFGSRIIIWKVDWEGNETNILPQFLEPIVNGTLAKETLINETLNISEDIETKNITNASVEIEDITNLSNDTR